MLKYPYCGDDDNNDDRGGGEYSYTRLFSSNIYYSAIRLFYGKVKYKVGP